MNADEAPLPNHVLQQILQERQKGSTEKTEKVPSPVSRDQPVPANRQDRDFLTDPENLMKVIAARSQNIDITEADLHG